MRKEPAASAGIIFRSIALFAILYQFRLLADDLADTAIFSAALFAAFAAAAFLAWFKYGGEEVKPLPAVIIIALVPWIARAFIAMPRAFISSLDGGVSNESAAAGFDALLLNYDRNRFVSLLPFYWAAATTWFATGSRKFLRAAVIADVCILVGIFTLTPVSNNAMYRWPVVLIALVAGIVFMQTLALLFSLPAGFGLKRGEKIAAIAALFILVITGGLIFLGPSQQQAAQKGGGLLEPKLFSFDFSQFLRLDSEISMNDDLILIVKKDNRDSHILLRRSVLSGYGKKQGFYRIEEIDERNHPQRLPSHEVQLELPDFKSSKQVYQEYFLVNFDAAAFIGMKEPVKIIPWESWDSSSFKSAYAVESRTSNIEHLLDYGINPELGTAWPSLEELGLSEKEFAVYTAYGDDQRIKAYAEELTGGLDLYLEKIKMIHDKLKFGEYRYSLKPGIAPDGDQLAWFLFNSKKGYCSYYAFAMALMLRSLGIPARVAAGFFIDPGSGVFDYYAVRSDMAHAWVEVLFPGYGWIEFDPTSESLAEGEELNFSAGTDPALLEKLMREIMENRSKLRPKIGQDAKDSLAEAKSFTDISKIILKKILLPMLIPLILLTFFIMRCGYLFISFAHSNRRKKAIYLWKHMCRRIRFAGMSCRGLESEWALRADSAIRGTYAMYLGSAAARFAPEYNDTDLILLQLHYKQFSQSYRKAVPLFRRILSWILPPAAMINIGKKSKTLVTMMLLLAFFAVTDSRAQSGDDNSNKADELYSKALESEYSENWERAIELYREGSITFPEDPRFTWALGNLYYGRSLYNLAWDEYRKAELISPYNTHVLSRLANTAGYLNRDKKAVEYLERLIVIDPTSKEYASRLGWMYFKVHRLEDGEALLVSAIEQFGGDPDLSMTLGTVYSDMYRYEEGRHWYKEAIAQAEPMYGFTAVAYYNLSILESRFYRYNLAMDAANYSLEAQNRASGLLMRGELLARRLDLEKAQADYETARELDHSPLAKLNLAQVYRVSGRLEESRLYAIDCLKGSDLSWMMNYGIDPIRYKRDIHEILYKTYASLGKAERFRPERTLSATFSSMFKRASYKFYTSVHRKLYQKYSLAAGDAYLDAGSGESLSGGSPSLDRYIQYYNAFETYPRRALTWLNKARDFETAIIPESQPTYDLEKGVLLKDLDLAALALDEFDPVWERDMIATCYREFAQRDKPGSARQAAAGDLFALNRGALLQAGISLPVEIRLNGENVPNARRIEKTMRRVLGRTGFTHKNGARYTLNITVTGTPAGAYSARCDLRDSEGIASPVQRVIPLKTLSKKNVCSFAGTLSGYVFRVE